MLSTAQARLAAAGAWALNEKCIVSRAGLDDVQTLLAFDDAPALVADIGHLLELPSWQ